ncbi:hypothetical protein DPSP01_001036 [Paraphaeosphaeria sporulosa]
MCTSAFRLAYAALKTTPRQTSAGEEVQSRQRGNASDYRCDCDYVKWNSVAPVDLDAFVRRKHSGARIYTFSMKRHPESPWSPEKAHKTRDYGDMMLVLALKAMTTKTKI